MREKERDSYQDVLQRSWINPITCFMHYYLLGEKNYRRHLNGFVASIIYRCNFASLYFAIYNGHIVLPSPFLFFETLFKVRFNRISIWLPTNYLVQKGKELICHLHNNIVLCTVEYRKREEWDLYWTFGVKFLLLLLLSQCWRACHAL